MLTVILTIILLLVVTALIAPVRVRVLLSPGENIVRVRYLGLQREYRFGAFAERLGEFGLHRLEMLRDFAMPGLERKGDGEVESPGKGPDLSTLWANRTVWRRVLYVLLRMVGRILRSWTIEDARAQVTFGLGNPAYTGMATGYAHAFWPTIGTLLPRWRVSFQPDFDNAVFAVDADIRMRLLPVAPLWHLIQALGALPWSGLWKMRRAWSA